MIINRVSYCEVILCIKSLNEALFLQNVIPFPKLLGDHFGFSLENVGDHLGAGTDFEFHLGAGNHFGAGLIS